MRPAGPRGLGHRPGVRGVRLFVDGIPASAPDGSGQAANFPLGSADRVEVVRGPMAALYGASYGGALLLYTEDRQRPRSGEVRVKIEALVLRDLAWGVGKFVRPVSS